MRPIFSTYSWALAQASSSVCATIGRNVTQMRGRSVRPAAAAMACTRSIWARMSASGSPQKLKMSPRRPPSSKASSEEPPIEIGIVSPYGAKPGPKSSKS